MRGVGPLSAPAALDSAVHEYSAIPARPMMASDFARFTTSHNALVSRQFSWQPSKPAGPTGHLALPSVSGRAVRADVSLPDGTDTMADQGNPHVTGFTMHDSMAVPEQPASATSGHPAELHQLPPLVPRRLSHTSNAGNSHAVNATISRWAAESLPTVSPTSVQLLHRIIPIVFPSPMFYEKCLYQCTCLMGGQEGEASDANPKRKPCVLLLHHAKDILLVRFDPLSTLQQFIYMQKASAENEHRRRKSPQLLSKLQMGMCANALRCTDRPTQLCICR